MYTMLHVLTSKWVLCKSFAGQNQFFGILASFLDSIFFIYVNVIKMYLFQNIFSTGLFLFFVTHRLRSGTYQKIKTNALNKKTRYWFSILSLKKTYTIMFTVDTSCYSIQTYSVLHKSKRTRIAAAKKKIKAYFPFRCAQRCKGTTKI